MISLALSALALFGIGVAITLACCLETIDNPDRKLYTFVKLPKPHDDYIGNCRGASDATTWGGADGTHNTSYQRWRPDLSGRDAEAHDRGRAPGVVAVARCCGHDHLPL